MVTKIEIQNYKCFKETQVFNCGKLNLFTGINGRGKSSVLQILLLLSQSLIKADTLKCLYLQGEHLNLGVFGDIKNSYTPSSHNIKIALTFDNSNVMNLVCDEDEHSEYRASVLNIEEALAVLKSTGDDEGIMKMLKHIHFVSADRLGPQMYVEKIDLPDFIKVGKRGEYTLEVLNHANRDNILVSDNMYIGKDSKSILHQTTAWMSYILDGARVEIIGGNSDTSVLSLLVNNRDDSYMYKPVNIGFGYSYMLPLVVSGLLAKPGEILIVENPEAHLHPKAQSRIAEFYARLAASGVQVFVESHSEHLLNGFRLACVGTDIDIHNTDTSIFFFGEDFKVSQISINNQGKMNMWPTDFFDQKERDLAKLMRLTR